MTRKKDYSYLQKIKTYYPSINPAEIEEGTNISIPSEEDIKAAKKWVDYNEK